jgi:Domain of unknown function (DUF4145)
MRQEFDNLLAQLQRVSKGIRELGEGIRQVAAIASNDPEMALIRTRKVLEYVVRDVYTRHLGMPLGTQPLESLLQQLAKEGFFPLRLKAYANVVKDLGNVGAHSFGEGCTQEDVQRTLTQLLPILEWYFQQERAVAAEPAGLGLPEVPLTSESVKRSPALSDRPTSAEPPPASPQPIVATQLPQHDRPATNPRPFLSRRRAQFRRSSRKSRDLPRRGEDGSAIAQIDRWRLWSAHGWQPTCWRSCSAINSDESTWDRRRFSRWF